MLYLIRDLALAATCWYGATFIDPYFRSAQTCELLTPVGTQLARWTAWAIYWWFQGLIFTGIWVIGHEVSLISHSRRKSFTESVKVRARRVLRYKTHQ